MLMFLNISMKKPSNFVAKYYLIWLSYLCSNIVEYCFQSILLKLPSVVQSDVAFRQSM